MLKDLTEVVIVLGAFVILLMNYDDTPLISTLVVEEHDWWVRG